MASMSLEEKLNILFEITKSSKIYLIAIFVLAFLSVILFTTNRKNSKSSRKLLFLLYTFIVVSAVVIYRDSLTNMYEYLVNNLFVVVYFPNLAIYLSAIIITSVILWISVFNRRTTKLIKSINIIISSLIYYLLIVLLNIISEQKLDVFNQSSIYTNKSAQAIIELSSLIFIIWILFLSLYKVIRLYQTKDDVLVPRKFLQKINNTRRPVPKRVNKKITNTQAPSVVKSQVVKPVIKKSVEVSPYENLLTKEDYKVLLTMLNKKKEEDKQKEIEKQKQEKELKKFNELQELYKLK